jgi:hypothetical protein
VRELVEAGWRVHGEEPCLRVSDDEGMGELAGEIRGGARACVDRLAADFDPQLAVQDEEGLLVGFVAVQGAVVAARSCVLEDRQLPRCCAAAGPDANERAQEPDGSLLLGGGASFG